jgi:hypothetical protein
MTRFHGVSSQFRDHAINFLVLLQEFFVYLIDSVRAHESGDILKFFCLGVQKFLYFFVLVDVEGSVIHLVDRLPNFLHFLPNLSQVSVFFFLAVQLFRVAVAHEE